MEKFFKVAEGAKPYADYELWMNENKKGNEVVCAFLDKHRIEAQLYFYSKDGFSGEVATSGDENKIHFGLIPVGEDIEKLKGHLKKPNKYGEYYFKKSSPFYKEFVRMAIENKLRNIRRPSAGGATGFFECNHCVSKSRLFMFEDVLYGSIECERLGAPKVNGIIEILGSEFYKVLEAAESQNRKNSERWEALYMLWES